MKKPKPPVLKSETRYAVEYAPGKLSYQLHYSRASAKQWARPGQPVVKVTVTWKPEKKKVTHA